MSQSEEATQNQDTEELGRNVNTHISNRSYAPNHPNIQIPLQSTGFYPWQPSSTTHIHQHQIPPQFPFNHPYPDMSYFHQSLRPELYTNFPYLHQNTQPPHHITMPPTEPIGNPHATQHTVPRTSSEASQRTNKNWTNDEDLQLTISWSRISTDASTGVGQKKAKLWDRVLKVFIELMESKHGVKPENNVRTYSGCENRMNEIKSQCSKWTAIRSRAFAQSHSGWSSCDYEKLCRSMFESEGKGPFKFEQCWKVLEDCPKWKDYQSKKSGNNSGATAAGSQASKASTPATYAEKGASNDLGPDDIEIQTPINLMSEPESPQIHIGGNSRATCTPILDGPASIEIQRPPGMKKSKGKAINQRQRRIKKHGESQTSVSHSFTAGLMTMQAETNARWEKIAEENKRKELKEDERYNELKQNQDLENEINVQKHRSELTKEMVGIGHMLLEATRSLDQMDPTSLITNTERLTYSLKRKAVQHLQDSYDGLEATLNKIKYNSPRSRRSDDCFVSGGTSQRCLFGDDVVNLGKDS